MVVVVVAVLVMVRAGTCTATLTVQRGSVEPDGQLLPAAVVDNVLDRTLLPVSGLFTVTVPVIVTVPPTGMLPVQVRPALVTDRAPELADSSLLGLASSKVSAMFPVIVIPL